MTWSVSSCGSFQEDDIVVFSDEMEGGKMFGFEEVTEVRGGENKAACVTVS